MAHGQRGGVAGARSRAGGELGLGSSFSGAIRDHLVGEDIMADYLLYTLNKQQQFG